MRAGSLCVSQSGSLQARSALPPRALRLLAAAGWLAGWLAEVRVGESVVACVFVYALHQLSGVDDDDDD